jgi:hypothetical protein
MARGRARWHDGRDAWDRLSGWQQDRGHPDDGDAALNALSDIGQVRRLLDSAELIAVRAARAHRRPWAEIATRLGVTRQSAWEKWRELDDTREAQAAILEALAADDAGVESVRGPWPARDRLVPDVVGLSWDDARTVLMRAGLVAVGPDPDGPPLAALGWPGGVVVKQDPTAGAVLPDGSPVTVWVERGGGGGAGDREPRRPKPAPLSARDLPDELEDEAASRR